MTPTETSSEYPRIAREVRKDVLSLIHKGQTSHIASCFSLVDIAVVLYENLKPQDQVIFSKGWASALYYVMEIRKGRLNREEVFNTFPNEPYGALLEPPHTQVPTGSVAHGLNVAAGIAYGKKLANEPGTVYVILSDGELNEGSTWEAVMFIAHHKLDNVVALIDVNHVQAMGHTKDIIDLEPIENRWSGFGWGYLRGDGHDYEFLHKIFNESVLKGPSVVICDTKKGKGVSFMEGLLLYHYKHVDLETYEKALKELQ